MTLCALSSWRNVTEEFKKALKTAEKSEFDTYEKGEELGIESNKCVEKSLLECSLKDAMSRLVGYRPRAPVDFAAEFMQIGKLLLFVGNIAPERLFLNSGIVAQF